MLLINENVLIYSLVLIVLLVLFRIMTPIKRSRGGYAKEQLLDAIAAVRDGKMNSVKAAEFYKVPQSTIRSHISNENLRVGAGRKRYLTDKQEGYLVDLLQSLDDIGVRLTKSVLVRIFGEYIIMVTKDIRFGKFDVILLFIDI